MFKIIPSFKISAFVGALTAVSACRDTATPVTPATAVKVTSFVSAASSEGARYSAQINPATRLDLAFKVGGYVESVATVPGVDGKPRPLQEGDRVRAGMLLASIRRTEYAQQVAEVRAAVAQAKASYDQAKLDLERTEKLVGSNAVAIAELDAARTRRDTALASVNAANARAAQAGTAMADTQLRAEFDGVVLRRGIEVGTLAAPGTVAFSLADVSSVKASFGVPDTALPGIRLGDVETIATPAYPGAKFDGRVSLIAPSADPRSRVFEVAITIPNDDGRLKPGMVVSLALAQTTPSAERAPLVPLSAIVRAPGEGHRFAVFVVETSEGRTVARARPVELGEYLGKVIPVRQGLQPGARIVVQGAGLLSDGEPVEVVQ